MLTTSFCVIDDFCKLFKKEFDKHILSDGSGKRNSKISLTLSEILTIQVHYHNSGLKTFKDYYIKSEELKSACTKK